MRIITISRELGGGGRELGSVRQIFSGTPTTTKKLIAAVAKDSGMDEGYIEKLLATPRFHMYPITIDSGRQCSVVHGNKRCIINHNVRKIGKN